MGTLKTEIREIISTVLLSHHEDLRTCHILIRYGRENLVINANQLLDMCMDENNPLLINNLLSDCNRYDAETEENIICEIRVVDNINNEIGSFTVCVKNVIEKSGLFTRILYDNLRMIDGDMPKLLESIVEVVNPNSFNKSVAILESLIISNPLHIPKGWINSTSRFKFGRLLYNIVLGMTDKTAWNGAVPYGGIIFSESDICKGFSYFDQTSLSNYLIYLTEFSVTGLVWHITISKS